MNTLTLISSHIIEVFEGNNWTDINIADTIKDISWQEAAQRTQASQNTIASIVHHLMYWNGIVMQRLNGIAPEINEANGFDVPVLKNESDWNILTERAHQSYIELADAVNNFTEDRLNDTTPAGKSSYYKTLHGITEHSYYHLGQIVMLKKVIMSEINS